MSNNNTDTDSSVKPLLIDKGEMIKVKSQNIL